MTGERIVDAVGGSIWGSKPPSREEIRRREEEQKRKTGEFILDAMRAKIAQENKDHKENADVIEYSGDDTMTRRGDIKDINNG